MNIEKAPKKVYVLDRVTNLAVKKYKNIIVEEIAVDGDPQAGTTLTASVTASFWNLSKSVTPTELNICNGASGTANYTISVIKSSPSNAFINGIVTVTNGGAVPTVGLSITVSLTMPPSTTVIASATVDVSSNPVLDPGETGTYVYSIPIPAGSITEGATYKVTADVTILNHSGHIGTPFGPSPSATAIFPSLTDVVHVTDILDNDPTTAITFTFSATGLQTYTRAYKCPDNAGVNTNTATIDETGQSASASVTVICHNCRGLIIE